MQVTPQSLESIYYAINTIYQQALQATEIWWNKLAMTVASGTAEERYAWMDKVPRMREWVGDRRFNDVVAREQAIFNKSYEDSLKIDRDRIEDDRIGIYSPALAMLGQSAAKWRDDVLLDIIDRCDTDIETFDGHPFFDTDHPVDIDNSLAGTYSNYYPDLPLTHENFELVRRNMMLVQDKNRKPMGVRPNLLVVSPAYEMRARQILKSTIIAPAAGAFLGGEQSQENVLNGLCEILVIEDFGTRPLRWLLLDTRGAVKPFVFQLRKDVVLQAFTSPNDMNVFMRKEFLYGVEARGNGGVSLPWLAAMAEG